MHKSSDRQGRVALPALRTNCNVFSWYAPLHLVPEEAVLFCCVGLTEDGRLPKWIAAHACAAAVVKQLYFSNVLTAQHTGRIHPNQHWQPPGQAD